MCYFHGTVCNNDYFVDCVGGRSSTKVPSPGPDGSPTPSPSPGVTKQPTASPSPGSGEYHPS